MRKTPLRQRNILHPGPCHPAQAVTTPSLERKPGAAGGHARPPSAAISAAKAAAARAGASLRKLGSGHAKVRATNLCVERRSLTLCLDAAYSLHGD